MRIILSGFVGKKMAGCFAKNLEKMMKEKRVSLRVLSAAIDVPAKTIHGWISGSGNALPRNADVLKRLADYFNVSTHFLIFGEEDGRGLVESILESTEIHTGVYRVTIEKIKTPIKK